MSARRTPPSRRRCRRKIAFAGGDDRQHRHDARTTRTCTSGGATTSPRPATGTPSTRRAWPPWASSCTRPGCAENAAGGPSTAKGRRRLPGQPGQAVQHDLRQRQGLLDRRAVEPDAVHPVRRLVDLQPARHHLHRAAPDPRVRPKFNAALRDLQRRYGGGHISEAQLEAGFGQWLPVHSRACQQRLSQFFTQWFDTAYPSGGGANRPMITGPGLAGPGFYSAPGACAA